MKKMKLLMVSLLILTMVGCSASGVSKDVIPFTTANWESTKEDVIEIEGREADEEYESSMGGMTYVYDNKSYEEYEGSLKYTIDENGLLSMVLFEISYEDTDELDEDYENFEQERIDEYGESGYSMDESETQSGEIWYADEANISVSRVKLMGVNRIMLSYANPTETE